MPAVRSYYKVDRFLRELRDPQALRDIVYQANHLYGSAFTSSLPPEPPPPVEGEPALELTPVPVWLASKDELGRTSYPGSRDRLVEKITEEAPSFTGPLDPPTRLLVQSRAGRRKLIFIDLISPEMIAERNACLRLAKVAIRPWHLGVNVGWIETGEKSSQVQRRLEGFEPSTLGLGGVSLHGSSVKVNPLGKPDPFRGLEAAFMNDRPLG